MIKHRHPGGITIRGWLTETKGPDFQEFESPTICVLNGQPLLRKDWDEYVIKKKDVITFVTVVGVVALLIVAIVLAVVSIVLSIVMTPPTPGSTPASDPVFSAKGQRNEIRLGEPIEVNYGKNRIYPALASQPFYRYTGNDQFQYSLFCIGQGYYTIHAVQIGDTDINDYQEVQYEILQPGDNTTFFRTNVYTSVEVGGQTIYAYNDPEWITPGWIGPFATNLPNTQVDIIEVDLVYPKGIYRAKKSGGLDIEHAYVVFEKRTIDNAGNPTSGWSTLFEDYFIAATTTPQRRTIRTTVTPARYEVRGRRPEIRDPDSRHANEVMWDGMRGFVVGNEPDFGNVTLLATRVRATSNLNSRTFDRFNVVATRHLPIRESGGVWSAPQPTRSIVWAMIDIFRSVYGGRITDDGFFDWDALETLDAFYESRNEHFDWTFRDPVTVWEAAQAVARVGRAIPLLAGSLITMKRDGPLELPVAMFTPDNIVKGSFEWTIKLWEPLEHDSIQLEYCDPDTGYKQENVLCILPDSDATGDYPKDVRIPGIANRDHAYREGLYILAGERHLRENISFETGMEGMIPSYGDLVAICHDVPRWGQSGVVLAVEDLGGDNYLLYVSEPLSFTEGETHQVLLRSKSGDILGPVTATEQSDPQTVMINISPQPDWLLGGQTEPMLFLFGVTGQVTQYGRLVKIEPAGGERVKLTVVNDAPVIHTYDGLTAPPLGKPSMPPTIPDLPVIHWLNLTKVSGAIAVSASWEAALGAQSYIVQFSSDGTNWSSVGETTRASMQFPTVVGQIWVRVAAIGGAQGPWIQSTVYVGRVSGLVNYLPWNSGLATDSGNDLDWGVNWWQGDATVDRYLVRVYDNTGSEPVLKRESIQIPNSFIYEFDNTDASADTLTADGATYTADFVSNIFAELDDNFSRSMLVTVDAMSENEDTGVMEADGAPVSLELINLPAPGPDESSLAYNFDSSAIVSSGFWEFTYTLAWTNPSVGDLTHLQIWLSTDPNLDTSVAPPTYDYTAARPGTLEETYSVAYELPDNVHDDLYYWIGLGDCWGPEIVVSGPAVIAPPWLLTGGVWTDEYRWRDNETWQDA